MRKVDNMIPHKLLRDVEGEIGEEKIKILLCCASSVK